VKTWIGQQLIIGISGHALTPEEKTFIVDNAIGGVILFARNVDNPVQIRDLCAEIQNLRHRHPEKVPLFIGVDMEGGRVARLKAPFTQWPPLRKLGDLDSPSVGFQFAYNMGTELKAVGINLDFAPCVDVLTNAKNTAIGDRSLGSNAEKVGKMASSLVRGYIKSGIIACAKHFPGHGNTLVDSHDDLPIEDLDLDRLQKLELIPFKRTFRARLDMIMTSHIKFPKVDPEWPVTLSSKFLKDILRQDLRYRGLVISDDLGMKAMTKHYSVAEVAVRAKTAGVDLLLYCNEPEAPPVALESLAKALENNQLDKTDFEGSYKRILEIKKQRLQSPDPLEKSEIAKIVGHADHFRLSQAIQHGEIPQGLVAPRDDE
jgi:beta-N-acetylhexosaminidase